MLWIRPPLFHLWLVPTTISIVSLFFPKLPYEWSQGSFPLNPCPVPFMVFAPFLSLPGVLFVYYQAPDVVLKGIVSILGLLPLSFPSAFPERTVLSVSINSRPYAGFLDVAPIPLRDGILVIGPTFWRGCVPPEELIFPEFLF